MAVSKQRFAILNKSGAPAVPIVPADHVDGFQLPTRPELVPGWARAWLAVSSVVVLWDASYVLLQPHSFYPEGRYGAIWIPYAKYATVDKLYSREAFEDFHRGTEGWGVTQSTMNLVEVALLALYACYAAIGQRGAALLALISCIMTAAKTIAYFLIDYNENWRATGHNDTQTWWTLFFLPSSLWIILPVLVATTIIQRIWREL